MSELIYKSAHVQKVVFTKQWGNQPSSSGDSEFITLHQSFKDPDYVLQDNISLYKVTYESAIFVETKKNIRNIGVTMTKQELFKHAEKTITMPLHSFHYIASQIKIPKHLALMSCGSASDVSATTAQVVMSESNTLDDIFKQKESLAPDQYYKMLKHAIKLFAKFAEEDYTYVISLDGQDVSQAMDVLHVFPNTKVLFSSDFNKGQKLSQLFVENTVCCEKLDAALKLG